MTVHVVGAYIRDEFMYCHALPREGESVAAHALAAADGGKGANQAIAAARLEAPVGFVGSLGADPVADHALTLFRREGVDVTGVAGVPGTATGRSFVLVADDASQVVATWPGAADALTRSDVDRALAGLEKGDILSIQGEIPLTVSLHASRVASGRAIVICNASPVEQFLAHPAPWADVDILVVNEVEAYDLLGGTGRPDPEKVPTRPDPEKVPARPDPEKVPARPDPGKVPGGPDPAEVPAELSAYLGVPTVVVTRGPLGATLYDVGRSTHLAAPRTIAVDPTGAGDAFAGSFAAELSRGQSLYHACRTAIAVASYSVTKRFCVPSYPTRKELESRESELAGHSW